MKPSEVSALCNLNGIDLVIDPDDVATDELTQSIIDAEDTEASVRSKVRFAQEEVAATPERGHDKRLVLRYLASPGEIGCSNLPGRLIKIRTVGLPAPGVYLKLADDGAILLRSKAVMRGYRNMPAQTAEALAEGWPRPEISGLSTMTDTPQ